MSKPVVLTALALLAGCSIPSPAEIRELLARCESQGLIGKVWNNTFYNGVTCHMKDTEAFWNAKDLPPAPQQEVPNE